MDCGHVCTGPVGSVRMSTPVHLVSLTSLTLCWFWTFALQKSKLLQNFFFWGSCYSNSLDIENTVATRNYYFILKNTRWIKIYFFSFFLTPSLATLIRENRCNASNSSLISKIIAYNLNKNTNKNAIKIQNKIFIIN